MVQLEGILSTGIQKGNMENWVYFERPGKTEFEDNRINPLAYSGRVPGTDGSIYGRVAWSGGVWQ